MGNLWTIFKREMAAYFFAPIAYIFIIVFVLINSGLYMTQFFLIGRADMQSFFISMPFLLSVFLPAVSMRLWAEEKRGNTLELLLTFPMSSTQLILGKFLASLVFFVFALAATLTIPFMLAALGVPDLGAIAGGYIGSLLLGAFYLAIGIFISGFVRDQIVAFILSMMLCFSIYFVGMNFFASSLDGWVSGLGSYLQNNVGAATHFEAFSKGVIDGADVFYFVLGSLIFLTLNGLWLEGRMRPHAKKLFTFAVIFSLAIFVLGNGFSTDLPLGRFDLTKAKLYTVSNASKQILKSLEAPVTAKLYISTPEKMPAGMKTMEQDLVGKLEEFSVASGGKFQYKVFHLDPNNIRTEFVEESDDELSIEERLALKGVQPFQIQSIDSDEVGVKLIYSSMTLAYKEKPEEVIHQLVPDSLGNLEYTVISKIFRMTLAGIPKVILVAPFKEKQMDPNFAMLMAQLGQNTKERFRDDAYDLLTAGLEQEGYVVERLGLVEGEEIPSDAKTMIILEPSKMTERQRYEINRFLVGGGSLFVGMQNHIFDYDPSDGQRLRLVATELEPGLNEMLGEWGVSLVNNILADDQNEVISIQGAAAAGPFSMAIPVKAPIQILISTDAMNPDISITSQLSSLFYLWGNALEVNEDVLRAQNLSSDVLFYSSPNSWLVLTRVKKCIYRTLKKKNRRRRDLFL